MSVSSPRPHCHALFLHFNLGHTSIITSANISGTVWGVLVITVLVAPCLHPRHTLINSDRYTLFLCWGNCGFLLTGTHVRGTIPRDTTVHAPFIHHAVPLPLSDCMTFTLLTVVVVRITAADR